MKITAAGSKLPVANLGNSQQIKADPNPTRPQELHPNDDAVVVSLTKSKKQGTPASAYDRAVKTFQRYDADGNGGVTKEELLARKDELLKAGRKATPGIDSKLQRFEKLDADKNGVLDFSEMYPKAVKEPQVQEPSDVE